MESLAMIAVMLDGPMTATKIPAPMRSPWHNLG